MVKKRKELRNRQRKREKKSTLPRREFLRGVALVGAGLLLDRSIPLPSVGNPRLEDVGLAWDSKAAEYYNDLANFRLMEHGMFHTGQGTYIRWFNYTDLNFSEDKATQIYDYFQSFPAYDSIDDIPVGEELISGVATVYNPSQNVWVRFPFVPIKRTGQDRPKSLFIVPNEAPIPAPWRLGEYKPSAATQFEADGGTMSFIHLREGLSKPPYIKTAEEYANKNLAVEICQSIMKVAIVADSRADYYVDNRVTQVADEAHCNSLGWTFQLKQAGVPYEIYTSMELTKTAFGYQLIKLSEDSYRDIPDVGNFLNRVDSPESWQIWDLQLHSSI